MPDLFERLHNEKKLIGVRRRRRHLLIFVRNPRSALYISKLAKERYFTKLDEGVADVEPVSDRDYRFVTVLVDIRRQLVLIQRKTSVFAEPDSARATLEEVLRDVGEFGRYSLILTEITPEGQFWDHVSSAEGIYQLQLTLHGPNFFEDLWKGDDIAKKVHERYGSTQTTIDMKNDRGGLKVAREVFADVVKVISAGGGRYLLGLKEKGDNLVKRITSGMHTASVWIKGEADHVEVHQAEQEIAEVEKAHDSQTANERTDPANQRGNSGKRGGKNTRKKTR